MAKLLKRDTNQAWGNTPGGAMTTSAISKGKEKPVILVVTRNSHLTDNAMHYALNVAERLNHRLLIAYVNTLPFLWDGGHRLSSFTISANHNSTTIIKMAQSRGVTVDCIKDTGRISKVVSRLCRILRKIEFILVDKDIKLEEVISRSPVPVFCVSEPEQLNRTPPGPQKT